MNLWPQATRSRLMTVVSFRFSSLGRVEWNFFKNIVELLLKLSSKIYRGSRFISTSETFSSFLVLSIRFFSYCRKPWTFLNHVLAWPPKKDCKFYYIFAIILHIISLFYYIFARHAFVQYNWYFYLSTISWVMFVQ